MLQRTFNHIEEYYLYFKIKILRISEVEWTDETKFSVCSLPELASCIKEANKEPDTWLINRFYKFLYFKTLK